MRRKGLPNKRVNTENKDVIENVSRRQAVGKKSVGKWFVNLKDRFSWRLIKGESMGTVGCDREWKHEDTGGMDSDL